MKPGRVKNEAEAVGRVEADTVEAVVVEEAEAEEDMVVAAVVVVEAVAVDINKCCPLALA